MTAKPVTTNWGTPMTDHRAEARAYLVQTGLSRSLAANEHARGNTSERDRLLRLAELNVLEAQTHALLAIAGPSEEEKARKAAEDYLDSEWERA